MIKSPTPTAVTFAVNLSTLFADVPLDDRAAAAAAAGFTFVESWWHFDASDDRDRIHRWCQSLDSAGVKLVLINLDAGDVAAGWRGLLSDPDMDDRFEANLSEVIAVLVHTGCRVVNALWGNRDPCYNAELQDQTALKRLVKVANSVAPLGVTVVVETLNSHDSPRYPLTDTDVTAQVVMQARARSKRNNIALLVDIYHLAMMGEDPVAVIRQHRELIGHIQFADFPGRGRPGTGHINFSAIEHALGERDYSGYVGLEYLPKQEQLKEKQ